ncbi:MAG: hypothetical protein ACRDG6_08985 [Candidatus Limnocylindria bacterium]
MPTLWVSEASRGPFKYTGKDMREAHRDPRTCELVETGGCLDPNGNEFWGIETFVRGGVTYVAESDMDFGVFILKRTP